MPPLPTLPTLYSFRRCPYAMRARLVLLSSGEQFILREILLKDKPSVFTELSPKATVPVLHLPDGTVLEESIAIVRHVFKHHKQKHGTPHGWDLYDDPAISDFADNFDGDFKHHADRYKYGNTAEEKHTHFKIATDYLTTLESRLQKHAYLFGDTPSLADIVALPFIRQFAKVDETTWESLPLPAVQKRLRVFLNSPLFQEAMVKYPPWKEGDTELLSPCDLSPSLE